MDRRASLACLCLGASSLLVGCSRAPIRGRPVPAGAPVLAVGDSLTHGTGATPETSYPAVLAGELYPQGIPIYAEAELDRLVRELAVDQVIF
ncbi:MAG TPA: hypothetical protein PLA97_09345, partial [Rubrivivax sp.]|nr:hypothetical protein [Rubrivivax sp.]